MIITTVHVDDLSPTDVEVDVAVVIDVVRAFTVAPWCIERGADPLLLAPSVDVAVAARRDWPRAILLKDGASDPRFGLPNAPGRICTEDLSGHPVIQRTGNGTRGAHAVRAAGRTWCASFVTATATARAVVAAQPSRVLLVPTEGDEDVALADHLAELIVRGTSDPTPFLARVEASSAADELRTAGPDPDRPGVHPDDLTRCLEVDRFATALRAEPCGDLLRIVPEAW